MKTIRSLQILISAVVLFISLCTINAQTDIPEGDVSGSWSLENSPYHINGDITIPDSSVLTIEPGVKVIFMGKYKLNIQGQLLAEGTAEDSIIFTVADTIAGWRGIKFNNTPQTNDTSRFKYCILEHGYQDEGTPVEKCGGAIFVMNYSKIVISHCFFYNNATVNTGYHDQSGAGAAIVIQNSSFVITHNMFFRNNTEGSYGAGGAIFLWSNANCLISNNCFRENIASLGGAILCANSKPTIINNLFHNNQATWKGGAIMCYGGSPVVINNTIVNNKGGLGGAVSLDANSDPVFINTIIYGNTGEHGDQVCIEGNACSPVFLYCNIEGGIEGIGGSGAGPDFSGIYEHNMDAGPNFSEPESGDFRLMDNSPCISAGTATAEINSVVYSAPATDYNGDPRPVPSGTIPDIGAFENNEGSMPNVIQIETNSSALLCYPNPLTERAIVQVNHHPENQVMVKVLSSDGRELEILLKEKSENGISEFVWNAKDYPNGFYFLQVIPYFGNNILKVVKMRQ